MISRLYPELRNTDDQGKLNMLSRTVTFQVTDACSLSCSYCYQINKGTRRMRFETAKKLIDMLLSGDERLGGYVDVSTSPGIIIEFIGGEPFLEVKLIEQICDYFTEQAIKLCHPWATMHMFSICSNGVAYFDPDVQHFLNKYGSRLSFSVTIDGNKELHDACRVFPDGKTGSYDLAVAAAKDWMDRGGYMGSKITIAPGNLPYLYDAIIHMVELGYDEINANVVYEKGWEIGHAMEFYRLLKRIADYWIDNDLVDTHYLALFQENFFRPKKEDDLQNWCWGAGTPILTTKGYKPIEEVVIGDLVYTEDGSIQPVIDVKSHFADNVVNISASGLFEMTCTDDHKLFAEPFDYIGNKYKKHYKEYGKYPIKKLKNKDKIKMGTLPSRAVSYNKEIAFLIGRYIGDGWSYNNHHSFTICSAFSEEKKMKKAFEQANILYSQKKNKTVYQFSILSSKVSKENAELNRMLSQCGYLATGKHVPPECLLWDDESLEALLNGYISADGCIKKNGKRIAFNTVSKQLAYDMMLILRTLGYRPTCYHNKRGGLSKILGRVVHIHDRYEVYYYKNCRSKYIVSDENGMWTTNLKYKQAEPQMVYNLTVATNHSYIAGCLVSSNCGGTGVMLSMDPDGYLYPCIRYMESSLGTDRKPLRIGHVDEGIGQTECTHNCIECLNKIDRRTQSTDECFYCPIAEGCSWCSAYNYQINGTPDSRCTYICDMHKARALANVYFWNKWYRKNKQSKRFTNHVPDEWALTIISKNELEQLKELESDESDM